jgi:tetratricopeptide (TPR) repeat protein
LWLFWNIPANGYIEFVRKCRPNNEGAFDYIHLIAKNFETSRNWGAFKLFLDGNFAEVNDTTAYAKAIAKGLNKDGMWSNMFSEYCQNKPELIEYVLDEHEKLAQEYIEQDEFSKAVKIYRDLASQCVSDQDKSVYELKVCECLFNSGQYSRTLSEIDAFINNDRLANKNLAARVMLWKGQIRMQLGEMDRASDIFSKIMAEYPKSEQTPEASFFIGYCHMLEGKHEKAEKVLNMVVKDYPKSSHASKARFCLMKIKRMTKE